MQCRPCSSRTPMSSGAPLHLMSTSVSLCTITLVFVNIEMVPSSEVFPTLISDVGKLLNVSAVIACSDNCGKGSCVTFFALHFPPFATSTFLLDERRMGIHASFLLSLLTKCLSAPESYVRCTMLARFILLLVCSPNVTCFLFARICVAALLNAVQSL